MGEQQHSLKTDLSVLRDAVMVAITNLYATDPDDVLRVFSVRELQYVSAVSEHLRPEQVEDIYRKAFDVLRPLHLPSKPVTESAASAARSSDD